MEQFKIRASALSQIMGRVGLTDTQESDLMALITRDSDPLQKPLTAKMRETMKELIQKRDNPDLPQTARTYLMQWYSGESVELRSKYIDKGIMCEYECIQFMAHVLDFGIANKNKDRFETDHIMGEPDVIFNTCIVDVKCSWDRATLQSQIGAINSDYWWQLLAYCILTNRNNAILFYGLMDTDESINYGTEVIYSDLPDSERWIAYELNFTDQQLKSYESAIIERVEMCRTWLNEYDQKVKAKLGRINKA
tara:strand:- start:6063 stop:6815 length:753 start_codon:yes stop_codon:yes gene_type:complete